MKSTATFLLCWGLLFLGGASSGCSLVKRTLAGPDKLALGEKSSPPQVEMTYRTSASRIDLACGGRLSEMAGPKSVGSDCQLTIVYPHPQHAAGLAQATLEFLPSNEFGDPIEGTWQLDIPEHQLAAMITMLKEDKFFQRSRTLLTGAQLAVEVDGKSFSKKYRAVPELDTLAVRALRQTTLDSGLATATAPQSEIALRRLPPVR